MTMQHQIHPEDERLAALAGDDPDVASDAELRAHVSGCDSCRATVADLSTLRSALAELPDLVPSRRLQLLPPVAEPRASGTGAGWLRRLAAPIMAAGFGLALVGAVGTSGINFGGALGGAASAPSAEGANALEGAEDHATDPASPGFAADTSSHRVRSLDGHSSEAGPPYTPASGSDDVDEQSAEASRDPAESAGRDTTGGLFSTSDGRLPWLVVLGLGVGLLAAGIYLRFALQPRAG